MVESRDLAQTKWRSGICVYCMSLVGVSVSETLVYMARLLVLLVVALGCSDFCSGIPLMYRPFQDLNPGVEDGDQRIYNLNLALPFSLSQARKSCAQKLEHSWTLRSLVWGSNP